MKHLFTVISIILLLAIDTASSTGRIDKGLIESGGKARAYYIYVPKTIKPASPAPLIVMLHGSGRNGLPLVEKWKDLAEKEGIILAGPDAVNSRGWSAPVDGPDFLRDLVESLKTKYPINQRRVYLFGHSAGAVFGIYMSLLESEYFAATVVHAGAIDDKKDVELIETAKRKIPIAIFVGTNDPFFPLKDVRATRDVLNAHGFSTRLTEMPNHNHDYYSRASGINTSAWEFFKQHELAEDQRYTQHNFK